MSDNTLEPELERQRVAGERPDLLGAIFQSMSDGVVVADETGRLSRMIGAFRTEDCGAGKAARAA